MFSSKSLMVRESELGYLDHGGALAVKFCLVLVCRFLILSQKTIHYTIVLSQKKQYSYLLLRGCISSLVVSSVSFVIGHCVYRWATAWAFLLECCYSAFAENC